MDQSKVSAQVFVEQVYGIGSWRGELAPPTTLSLGAARAMTRLVLAQPAIAIGRRADMQLRLFGLTDDDGLQALRAHSVGFMVAGALALGMTGQPLKDVVLGLVHASADIDPDSLLLRAQLLWEYPFAPPVPLIPDWLDPRDRFTGADCYAAVVKAVLELGRWADSGWTTDATGIGSMSASTVCPGALLEIYGVAFPDPQPPDTRVYVPTRNGGSREATVESWSNSRIAVRIPVDIGPGCVGFVRCSGTFQEPQQVTGAHGLHRCCRRGLDPRLQAGELSPRVLPSVSSGWTKPHRYRRRSPDQHLPFHAAARGTRRATDTELGSAICQPSPH